MIAPQPRQPIRVNDRVWARINGMYEHVLVLQISQQNNALVERLYTTTRDTCYVQLSNMAHNLDELRAKFAVHSPRAH